METVWKHVKNYLKKEIPTHSYNMWIEPITWIGEQDGNVVLACPNAFSKNRVIRQYEDLIQKGLNVVLKKDCQLLLEVAKNKTRNKPKNLIDTQKTLPNFNIRPFKGRFLRQDFTFDRFVVGGNNDFAYKAATSMAKLNGSAPKALFLLSKTGLGKSHLSQAVGHYIIKKEPSQRVYYTTAEGFMNEMVDSYHQNTFNRFKDKYQKKCDVLLLEDIHNISGKERTQKELSSALDALMNLDKKVIFTSCYLPNEIPKLNDTLKSRLTYGLVSHMDAPDFRTRVRILQNKSQMNGYLISNDVIEFIASELNENIRQLESGLVGVVTKAKLLHCPIDHELAAGVIKQLVSNTKSITIENIKKLISRFYTITVKDMESKSRKLNIVKPRQIAMYLSRQYTDQPLQAIGKSFNRYHATALYAVNSIEKQMKENGPAKKQVEFFCQKLESGEF